MSENLTFNQISTLASDLRAVSDATYPVKGIISDEYDSTAHYVVGDYCIRNNILYRCNTDTPNNGEVWNVDHWDESSVGEVLSKIDWKLLWENASPASAFSAQTIQLDLSNYTFIIICFIWYNGEATPNINTRFIQTFEIGASSIGFRADIGDSGTNDYWISSRPIEITNSSITFSDCRQVEKGSTYTTLNTVNVPYKIYGLTKMR